MGANHLIKIYGLARSVLLMILFAGSITIVNSQNYALTFDGSGDFVNFGSPAGLQITGNQTIEMWIYPYSMNARRNPIAKAYGGEGTMTLETDGTINYFYGTGGGNNNPYQGFASTAIPVNEWTHIALVRDLSAMKLYWYFNGVQVAVADAQFPNAQSGTLPFYIGRGYVSDFHGMLDDVRVWNIARTPSEIAAYKNAGLSGFEAGLAAYWPFDEGSGNTIMDNTPNGNNGTRNGNTAFLVSSAPVYPYSPGSEPFESVPPTGLPYNIVLAELTINGGTIPTGAQIGVFDGELCVGTVFYNGSPNQNLVAWQSDPEQNLAGFTPGNPMTFKYRMPWHSEIRNFDAVKTMVRGNGNFGFSPFSVVNLAATTSLIPEITILAETINFNTVVVNQSLTLPLAFENNGTATLSINSIQNSVSNFVKSATALLIAPGAKDTLWITFTPTAVTSYSDVLTFLTDDPDVPSVSVSLYGTGLPQPSAQIIVTPSSLNFGGIAMNTTKTMTFNILNPGNGNLTVTGITSSNALFTVLGSTSFTLGQGENRNVSVVFSPTQPGGFSGQLTIQNNAQNVVLPVAGVASKGHFTSVAPTGKPYTILAEEIDIDGFSPKVGDEVAVFDDELCVGIGIAGGGGNSLQLNGSNGYVINDNSAAFDLQQLTISAWVFSSNFSQNGFIFEKGPVNSQYSLFFEGGNINFRTYPSSGGWYDDFYVNWSSIGIQNNQWNHITATYNGVQKAIYVNGQLKATKAFSQPLRTGQAGQIIGAYGGSGGHSYFFNGRIDEVRIWSKARSVFEIQADMYHELKGNEPNLVGYWNFNEGNFNNLVAGSTPSYLVGNANLQGAQNPDIFQSMLITAWEKDDALGLPGFTSGNPMSFKVWTQIYDNWVEINAVPDYLVGNGNFGFGQMTVMNLDGTSGLAPDIFVPIESLYVGQVTVGSSVVKSVEIFNQGNAPLHFTLSDNSTAFSTNISSGTIAPSGSLEFQVTFTPTTAGGYSAILLIQSNDPDEPEIAVNLEGFALPSGASNIATSVNQMTFGNVAMGSPVTLPIVVINTGTTALTVSNITFNNSAFTATPTSFTLQNTNDLKEVLVTFLPGAKGLFSGIMTIASNAPQKQIGVSGIGFEDHFNHIEPTGLPYTIIVQETNLSDYISPGDELSVFDGELAVGMVNGFSSLNTKSAKFSGSNSYLQVANTALLNPATITVEAWVRTTDGGASRSILSKTNGCASSGYLLWLNQNGVGAGRPGFWVGDGPWLDANVAVHDGQWHHIAGTFDGTTARIYVDGVLRNSRTSAENLSSSNPLQIGGSTYCGNYLIGNIDEVKIWNYALNAQQVQQSMNSAPKGNEVGLTGYWSFEGDFNDKSLNNLATQVIGSTTIEINAPLLINNQNMSITAWQKDVANGLPGFTPGNPMSFKLWTEINGFPTELTATPTYVVGNGNFGFGQFTVVNLEFGLPDISVDPMEIFVALEEPDATERTLTISNSGPTDLEFGIAYSNLTGNNGNSMYFDGSDDYLVISHNYPSLNELTLEAWIYPTNVSGPKWIFSTGRDCCSPTGGFNLSVQNGTLQGQVWRSATGQTFGVGSANIVKANEWQHVSMTYNGTQIKLFLNGHQVAASEILSMSAIQNGSNNLHLGILAFSVPSYYDFAGNIDEARIWNYALTETEIRQNVSKILSGSETGLLGYWNFDDGTAADLTANGRNGTVYGNAAATAPNAPVINWIEVISLSNIVPATGSTDLTLEFNSTGLNDGLYGLDLLINNNTPGNSPVTIPVSMNVTGNPQISASVSVVEFGQVVVNTSSQKTFNLKNIGTKDLIITSISMAGGNANGFGYLPGGGSLPLTLVPGQSAPVVVEFIPVAPGQATDMLVIASNAGNAASFEVALSGLGITPPEIFLPQTAFSFSHPCNSTLSNSFIIQNEGQDNLAFTIVSNKTWLAPAPLQATVAGGENITINVNISTFDLFAGTHQATLSIQSNDPAQPVVQVVYTITITGEPVIVANDFINLGTTNVGETYIGQLTVANGGCDDLEVFSVDIQSQFAVFTVLNPGFIVPPGDAVMLLISFTPLASQQYSGIITINSNDASNPALPIVVAATGVEPPKMSVFPLAVTTTLQSGDTGEEAVTVQNTGGLTLQFTSEVNPVNPYMVHLDGNGDYINVNHSSLLNPANAITLEAWVYLYDNTNEFIIGKENSTEGKYRFYVNGSSHFEFKLNNQFTVTSTQVAAKNQWYHVAATFDGSSMRIFVNGNLNAEQTFSPFTILPNTDNLRIGRSYQFHYFNGLIDEVRVWNIARNQSEIQSAMSQPLLGTEPELLLYFPFNSPSGNIVTDASTNTHNGIMFGDPVRLSSTVPFSDYLTLLNGSGNLTAGQQQDITLNLNSAGVFAGNYQRQIKVNSNAIDNPIQHVSLNFTVEGEGNVAPNPAQVQFENTFIGLKDTFELVIANTGATASLISGITFSNPAFYSLNTITKVFPFSQKSLMLIFEPGQDQTYNGMLTITFAGGKSPDIQVSLAGIGVTPPIPVLNPLVAEFGSVVVNHSESIGFTLGNNGSSALVVNSFSLTNNAVFTTNLQLPLSLSFGQQTQFDITFTPVNYVPANAQMLLSTNIGQINIPLSGVGVPPDHDLAVTAILSPLNGCGLSNAEVLIVTIQNYGTLAQSNFNVGFKLNGGAQVVETFNGTLASGQSVNNTFNQTLNLAAIGNFNLEVSTLLGNDQNVGNDKLNQVIVNSPSVGAVTGLLPADGASGVVEPVVFSWAATPNATAYDLYLWRTTQQKPATPTVAGITGTSHTYTQYINKNYIYNWQITARNQCSQSESAVQVFSFNVFSDLTVNSVVAPEAANSGEFVDITFTVANIGTGGTGIIPWKDDIFLSLTPVFDAVTAVKVASVNNKNTLNPGQSYTNTVNIKLGDYLEGSFYVFVVTDANNIIQETDETNNRLGTTSPMAVSLPPYPDITANNIQSLSGNIIPGQPLTVGWNVLNIGDAPAVGGWSQRIAIVSGSATQVLGFVQSSEALDPSGIIGLSASFNVPQQLNMEGDVFLQVRLTPNAALVEKPNGAANNTVLSDAALLLEKRLTISIPQPTLNENSTFPLNCMVYRSGNLSQSLTLTMSASEANRVNIPATVIIPAGQAGAPFSIAAIDNSIIEGNIALQILANAPGYPTGVANLTIIDDETPSLALTLSMTEATEGDIFQLTVIRDLVTANPLTVTLFTTKPNQIALPANIVIPANESSATINVTVVQNTTPELTEDVVINATVAGYLPASATITILDDDLPQVTLTLNPTTVSEGGGPYASWGTVSLAQPATSNIIIMISANPSGQLFFPAQVVISQGQIQQQFNIGVVDNGILDGDRTVEITAAVFIASCGCGAPAGTGGADTKILTILDNDGPSLSVSANPFVVPENIVNAGLLTITRNTLGGPAITVNIQHNRPSEIQIQPTVVIPEGATSVTVPFNTLDDGIEDGDQIVTLTVTSQNYASGSCWIIVSDRNLPDYVAGNMNLSQNSILINDPVQISFTISNEGFALAGDGAEVKIFRSNDNMLSNDDLLLSTQYTNTVLNIGGSLQMNYTYTPTDKVGDFFIIARVNGNGAKAELVAINNTTQAVPLSIVPDYSTTVTVNGDVFNGTSPIIINGVTESLAKTPAPNKAVDVYVVVNGARRLFNAVSDHKGEFTVNFVPINGEAGEYIVGACYPGQNLNDAQDNFTILGARPTATGYIIWDIWLNETRTFFLEIQNFSGLDLNNLQLQVLSGPPGCAVNFTPVANLPGNSLTTMSYSITANQITNGTQYEEVKLQLTSAEGTKFRFSAWFYSRATMGNLKLNPAALNKTMVRGAINYAEFQVTNNGLDSTGVISVLLPQNNWLSLANNNSSIASLAPGQSAVVTLKLMPGNDLQLNNPITGQIALSGTNSNSVGLPFTFEPVSVETGNFLVDVVDEYTYNTEAAPHLEGATVIISHPYTGQIIAQGITDVNGHFLASNINEGYYNLRVSAPRHANHQSLIYVEKAVTTTKLVFIAFQAITYTWQVVPTMIQDQYEITLVAVFETNVPAPVVTMSMPDTIPQLNFGEVFPFILVMTNHGLITAKDVEVAFPEDDEYEFIANANMLDILPQTAVQIPVIVQRRDPNKSAGRSSNCSDFAVGSYQFECGPDDQLRLVMKTVYYKGRYCGGSGTGGPGGGGWCWWCGGGGPGGPGGPGGGGIIDQWEIPTVPYTQSNTGCDPCLAEFLNALWSCTPIPNIGIGSTQIGLDGKLSDAWQIIKPIKDLLKKLKCAWNIGWSIGCKINNTFFNKSMIKEGPPELVQAEEDLYYVDKGFAATENIALEVYNNQMLLQRESFGIFNDSVFINIVAQTAIDAFRQAELLNVFTNSDIPQIEMQDFFTRWNTTMEAWNLGFYSPTPDYPNIIDSLLLYNYTLSYDTALNYAIGRGYSSIEALYNAAYEIVAGYTEQESSAVCATVTVQFSQMLTMTREAFEGTLTIFNGHESDAMENILLELEVKDENGFIRNDLFEIVTKSLYTLTGIDGSGTLAGQAEGSAVILFIPERGAAPDVPRFYSFGGKLSYLDPFTGEIFEQPLFPVTLQVNPSPDLYINYFMQRDIYGDDALTEPIEPMIPAELAVMIDNRGAGTAYSVNIESAQPEIIENEKGLLIDFNIVGSSLSGQPVQLGLLNVDFGDIPGGDIRVGQWWFTSTLLGHFISYEVSVNHLNSFGNPNLSLISEVNVHELIKGVRVYGPLDDGIGDFLVNDIPDTDDIPDALYYSNGTVAPVYQANNAVMDSQVTLNDLETELTVTPFVSGWNYKKINDPGNGYFRIVSCTREDGQIIPLENIWLTYVTIPDGGEPIYENKLHFLDIFDGVDPVNYTIVWEAIDMNFPDVTAINGIPASGITDAPITNLEVVFNKPIDPATFDHEDLTLRNQGGPNLIDPMVTVAQVNDTTFNVDISSKTAANGFYVFTVQAAGIADMIGNYGQVGKQATWIQAISTPAIDYFFGIPQNGQPTDTLLVLFNMPINVATFTTDQIVLTDGNGNVIPSGSLVITGESFNNVLFKISGLLPLASADGTYMMTFKVTEILGETGQAGLIDQTTSWTVCQIPLPSASIGSNATVCIGESYQLNGVVQNASGFSWATSGTGTFSNPQILNPVYTPSQADIAAGSVQLSLTAQPLNACAVAATSTMNLTIENAVQANAGNNALICQNATHQLFGTVANASGFRWISSGNGTFSNPNILTPVYTPGSEDIANGFATLSLIADPLSPCILADTSSMTLNIQRSPTAYAGANQTICQDQQIQLQATATNYSNVFWVGGGSGTFNNRTILNPVYTLGELDIERGYVAFLFVAEATNPCFTRAFSTVRYDLVKTPLANAGANATICANQSHQLVGVVFNHSGFTWETSGDGTFSNTQILNPVYNSGSGDQQTGNVQLMLTAMPLTPCQVAVTSAKTLTIQKLPVANAGLGGEICENQSFQLNGSVLNTINFQWLTTGDGTFGNGQTLNPLYFPGANDIQAGSVVVTLVANPTAPCLVASSSAVVISIQKLPVVNAGANAAICEDQTYQLAGSAANAGTVQWTTAGDGMFNDDNSLQAVYTPGAGDLANGTVLLTLTAQAVSPCLTAVSAHVTLTIQQQAFSAAGDNTAICEGETFQLNGFVANAESFFWQSSGDGSFDDNQSLNAVYTPGTGDLASGTVVLTLTATPLSPCSLADESSLVLSVQPLPVVNAGDGGSICHYQTFTLGGTVENAQSFLWSSNGGGTFGDAGELNTSYAPGESDINAGSVILTLSAAPISPCTISITDQITLQVNYCHDLVIPSGWSGLSTFVNPLNPSMEAVFEDVVSELIILQSFTGMYWPGQQINNIGNWSVEEGYYIKVANQITLTIAGSRSTNKTLQLSQGWNLIPVLSECDADVEALFAGKGVIVVKEVAGWQLYWPQFGISTLQNLQTGKAYYVLMANAETITFPGCTKNGSSSTLNSTNQKMLEMIIQSPWNTISRTAITHIIALPKQVINTSLIRPGDYLGAFDQQGNCYGMIMWEGDNTSLTLFGDDPTTTGQDGFLPNEPLYFRMYIVTTGKEYTLDVTWDQQWPQQDGTFAPNGISAIAGLTLGATQVGDLSNTEVLIYPNPAGEVIFVDLVNQQEVEVTMTDIHGREALRQSLNALRNQLDLANLRSGIYLMKLEGNNFSKIEKVIKK